ncbi:hypothetical protein ACU8V7_07740 [Zobellia nedashkovskayae]
MKKKKVCFSHSLRTQGRVVLLFVLFLGFSFGASAQTVSIERATTDPSEGGAGTSFTLTRTGTSLFGNGVSLVFSGSAVNGVDYTDGVGNAIETFYTMNNGNSEEVVNIIIVNDDLIELEEDFKVKITSVSGVGEA